LQHILRQVSLKSPGDSPIENRLASGALSQVGVYVLAGD
jgi:hypothetical protein